MLLGENYILGNELVEKMGIRIGNVSINKKELEDDDDYSSIVKLGNCTFLDKTSKGISKSLKNGINTHKLTDMSNLVPASYAMSEMGVSKKTLDGLVKDLPIFKGYKTVSDKIFVEFEESFVNKVKNSILYVLSASDYDECMRYNYIDGFVQLTSKKYLVWYYV